MSESSFLFLMDHEQDALGRALHDLEVMAPRLDDLMLPSSPASGTNAGRPAGCPGSRPPLSLHVCDVKADAEEIVRGWCAALIEAKTYRSMKPRTLVDAAKWLHQHLMVLAEFDWAPVAAEEIIAQARRVGDLVDPPPSASSPTPLLRPAPSRATGRPAPNGVAPGSAQTPAHPQTPAHTQEVDEEEAAGDASFPDMWGNCSRVENASRLLGDRVSRRTIRRWAEAGHVRTRANADGSLDYSLADTLAHSRRVSQGQAPALEG